ncbi:MAG TPA: hypothetical protein VHB98_20330 [Chloroflexota bacterium]|jgi:hypothetical protein|nr:hypothetical protein [Chloroflexota bacterium]
MRIALRLCSAALCLTGLVLGVAGGARTVHANSMSLRVLYQGQPARLLTPGIAFLAEAHGVAAPRGSYCLGLASMRDRYGLPVSLGVFRSLGGGAMTVQARIPARVFPAEPAGLFLLFIGHCTDVAPDGILGSVIVNIVPAVG